MYPYGVRSPEDDAGESISPWSVPNAEFVGEITLPISCCRLKCSVRYAGSVIGEYSVGEDNGVPIRPLPYGVCSVWRIGNCSGRLRDLTILSLSSLLIRLSFARLKQSC